MSNDATHTTELNENDVEAIGQLRDTYARLRDELGRVIVGQYATIERLAICMFARGHGLLMGVPGLAKTLLVRKLAETMSLKFSRIQFTPDLMPMDITGTDILQDRAGGRREFEFVYGPVFANIVLADEINRAPPKTQAAMLEAMQEQKVTVVGKSFPLASPFMVLATQNPIEHHGTYPLPESQLDRFLMRIELGYPAPAAEKEILKRFSNSDPQHPAGAVLTPTEVLVLQDESRKIHIEESIIDYMIEMVNRTRRHPDIELGVSPRGTAALFRAAQSLAMLEGRSFVIPDDIKKLVHPVFEHRLGMVRSGSRNHRDAGTVLQEIVDQTPVPA